MAMMMKMMKWKGKRMKMMMKTKKGYSAIRQPQSTLQILLLRLRYFFFLLKTNGKMNKKYPNVKSFLLLYTHNLLVI